jgi:endoglucanase
MQRIQAGVAVGTISIPTRYIHTSVEMAHQADIDASIALMAAFIEEGHTADLALA